eukprot:Filipodium_phascolosomae@DN568_c0_g1_i1.p1
MASWLEQYEDSSEEENSGALADSSDPSSVGPFCLPKKTFFYDNHSIMDLVEEKLQPPPKLKRSHTEPKSPKDVLNPNNTGVSAPMYQAESKSSHISSASPRKKSKTNLQTSLSPSVKAPPPKSKPESTDKQTIKEKERLKRMKGQSSHASWKPEEWMRLRQQFD